MIRFFGSYKRTIMAFLILVSAHLIARDKDTTTVSKPRGLNFYTAAYYPLSRNLQSSQFQAPDLAHPNPVFRNGSFYSDGSGQYLCSRPMETFDTNDFTVEMFFKPDEKPFQNQWQPLLMLNSKCGKLEVKITRNKVAIFINGHQNYNTGKFAQTKGWNSIHLSYDNKDIGVLTNHIITSGTGAHWYDESSFEQSSYHVWRKKDKHHKFDTSCIDKNAVICTAGSFKGYIKDLKLVDRYYDAYNSQFYTFDDIKDRIRKETASLPKKRFKKSGFFRTKIRDFTVGPDEDGQYSYEASYYVPPKALQMKKTHLLFVMHGEGGPRPRYSRYFKDFADKTGVVIVAPEAIYDEFVEFVFFFGTEHFKRMHPFYDRYFLVGFSYGIAPVMLFTKLYTDQDILGIAYSHTSNMNQMGPGNRDKNIPILAVCGQRNDPQSCRQYYRLKLKAGHFKTEYKIIPNQGHNFTQKTAAAVSDFFYPLWYEENMRLFGENGSE